MGRWGETRRGAAAAAAVLAALLAAGCGSGGSGASRASSSRPATATRAALASRYLVIARAGNERLEDDFDPLEARDRNDLARARADLADAAATERLFDRRLRAITFPAATERTARRLYRINQTRATLTAAAAAATSLSALHSYEPDLDAANGPVEQAVATIRRQLGLPPADTS